MSLGYDDYRYFMTRVTQSVDEADGGSVFTVDSGGELDLERDFEGLRYKQFEGVSTYGAVKSSYAEDYAEEDGAQVYVSTNATREQTEPVLTLYFFCADGSVTDFAGQYKAASELYHSFVGFLSGCYIIYRDTIRQRRLLLYLSDEEELEPETDSVKGKAYIECEFSFKNVFGKSFSLDDTTIADYLGLEEYPAYGE